MTTTDWVAHATVHALTRADVRVSRNGWVTRKDYDETIGLLLADVNGAGDPIWRAQAGDVGGFAFTRADAVSVVIELHTMQEKARAYDLLLRALSKRQG